MKSIEKINNFTIEFESSSGRRYYYLTESGFILQKTQIEHNTLRIKKLLEYENQLNIESIRAFRHIKENEIKEYLFKNGFHELLIEITTGCNLRCKYCVFSGNYKSQRVHGNKMLSIEDAKKAIDLYFSYIEVGKMYNPNRKPTVAFYGGEPLLNFEVIKESITYIRKIYEGDVFFTLTTNGILLTDEMIDFFIKEDVWLVFSLDGPAEEHNRNRIMQNGKGTFNIVFRNIKKYHDKSKKFVFVNSVYDYKSNLKEIIKFFSENKYLVNLSASLVNPYDTLYYEQFTQNDYIRYKKMVDDLKKEFFNYLHQTKIKDDTYISLLNLFIGKPTLNIMMRKMCGENNLRLIRFTGSCIPGEKIYVDINGNIRPCEKIGCGMNIGNIYNGINFKAIQRYLNEYNVIILNHCKNCKFKGICSYCFQSFWKEQQFRYNSLQCNQMRSFIIDTLILYCDIMERNPRWFDVFTKDYYSNIDELAVTLK